MKTITPPITLKESQDLEKIKELNEEISAHPLEFHEDYSAESIRKLNRRR